MTAIHRRPGVASVAALAVMTTTVVFAHLFAPSWSRRVGLDVWNYGFDVEDHRQCSERRKDLEAGQARLHQQIDIGDQLAAQLIDDHLSLVDAADMILNANKDRSGFIEAMGYQYGTSTSPRQRCARYLMLHVELRLRDTGATSRVPETLTRLEVDYRAMPPNP